LHSKGEGDGVLATRKKKKREGYKNGNENNIKGRDNTLPKQKNPIKEEEGRERETRTQ